MTTSESGSGTMTTRAMGRFAAVTGAVALAAGALLSAVPATAEDAVSPSPSPTAESPTASPSATLPASPEATGEATASPQPSQSAAPEVAAGNRPQTISVEYVPDLPVGQVAMLKATASSDLDVDLSATGTCRLRIEGDAFVAVATDAGNCTVTATQEGDDEFAAAPEASQTFEFYPAESDVSARIPGDDVVEIGKPMTVRLTVKGEQGNDPAPSGTVTVKIDGLSLGSAAPESLAAALDDQGMATIIVPEDLTSTLTAGPLTLYAAYAGDNGYQEARASATFDVLAKGAGYVVPPAGSPVARFINQYQPIRGFSYEPRPSNRWNDAGAQWVTEDSDYYNADFAPLWGVGNPSQGKGRNDLGTMAKIGVNMLHIYNWNPDRKNHNAFLDYARDKGMGVTIPISNYAHYLLVGNGQGIPAGQGSPQRAFDFIKGIFDQVYLPGDDRKPHGAAAIWDVFNEFDGEGIPVEEVVFVIQSILKLEKDLGIPESSRLPFFVPTTTGDRLGAVNGIGATLAVRDALRASSEGKLTAADKWKELNLPNIPKDFWQTRFIASTNPFQDAEPLGKIILQTWPNAFKGGDAWSDLPPMFFGEMGIQNLPNGASQPPAAEYDRNGKRIRAQLACTNPLATNRTAPGGYFLGATMFEFSQEFKVSNPAEFDWWGVQTFADPNNARQGKTTSQARNPGDYLIDELQPQPGWDAIREGFADTTGTCPGF
jgi:hypothetical protein